MLYAINSSFQSPLGSFPDFEPKKSVCGGGLRGNYWAASADIHLRATLRSYPCAFHAKFTKSSINRWQGAARQRDQFFKLDFAPLTSIILIILSLGA